MTQPAYPVDLIHKISQYFPDRFILWYHLFKKKNTTVNKQVVSTSILIALRLIVMAFKARKKTLSTKSVFGWTIPLSCETEKSSPRFSSPVRRQDTGSRVTLRIVRVFVSLLSETQTQTLRVLSYQLSTDCCLTLSDRLSTFHIGNVHIHNLAKSQQRPRLCSVHIALYIKFCSWSLIWPWKAMQGHWQ